jgi:hypothetical protein
MSLLENLTIKDEKTLNLSCNKSYNSKNIENNYSLLNNDKIIVYNLGNKYLVPMIVINKKNKTIKNDINNNYIVNLNFINEENLNEIFGEDIKINLNDIYFEKISSFYFKENFIEIKNLNDLSLLYNIKMAKLNHKIYSINDKIKILINYIFKESKDFNNTFFYQKYINYIFENYDFDFIDYIIETFLIYNCQEIKIIKVIIYIIQLFYFLKNLNFFLKIDKKIMFFPFFSSNNLILNNKSILFTIKKINNINYNNEEIIKKIINNNFKDLLFYNENKFFIYIIYRIFCDFLKNENLFINVMSLLYIGYLHYLKNNIFYSNITILCLYIYIINFFIINKEIKNILIFSFLINNNEDDILILSELIKDNIINNELNKNSLTNLYYFTININYYINNNYKNFEDYIIQIENKFNLNFLKLKYKDKIKNNSKYKSLILNFFNEYIYYNKDKLKFNENIYILNDISLIFKKNNFNIFLNNSDLIPKFLKITNILNLTKYYQKNNKSDNLINTISKFNYNDFYNKILIIQNNYKNQKIYNYIKKLRKNTILIQRFFKKYLYNKILKSKNNNNLLIKYIIKYKKIDSLIYNILLYYKDSLNYFIKENKEIKNLLINNEKNNKIQKNCLYINKNKLNDFKEIFTFKINENQVNQKDYIQNEINNYLLNYKKLINSSENYLFKIKKLINIIYSNDEIKKF